MLLLLVIAANILPDWAICVIRGLVCSNQTNDEMEQISRFGDLTCENWQLETFLISFSKFHRWDNRGVVAEV